MTAYFDQIDILVHAVGYVHQGTIEECSPADWRRSCFITLDSAYFVLGAAIPKMKAHGGSIITIGSVASSIKGFPKRAAYGAAKGGVLGLTKAVAADYISQEYSAIRSVPARSTAPTCRNGFRNLPRKWAAGNRPSRFSSTANLRGVSGRLMKSPDYAPF